MNAKRSALVLTGLTLNTPYWIDLAQENVTVANAYHFANVSVSAIEQ